MAETTIHQILDELAGAATDHYDKGSKFERQDRALTSHLKEALKILDIRLLDHFVVSTEGYTSLAARGWV